MPEDEEGKKLLKLAQEADAKEESYYRKAMKEKDAESQILRLREGIPEGKKKTYTLKSVEKAVEERKAPFMGREDYQEKGELTKAEKLEFPNPQKFPERHAEELRLAKKIEALRSPESLKGYRETNIGQYYDADATKGANLMVGNLRWQWAAFHKMGKESWPDKDGEPVADYLDFVRSELKQDESYAPPSLIGGNRY